MMELQTEVGTVRVPAGTWRVDPSHSSVAFEVKHLTIRDRTKEVEVDAMAAGALLVGEEVTILIDISAVRG
jgi:polyisoprenoid-binding protein YceI